MDLIETEIVRLKHELATPLSSEKLNSIVQSVLNILHITRADEMPELETAKDDSNRRAYALVAILRAEGRLHGLGKLSSVDIILISATKEYVKIPNSELESTISATYDEYICGIHPDLISRMRKLQTIDAANELMKYLIPTIEKAAFLVVAKAIDEIDPELFILMNECYEIGWLPSAE